MKNKNGNKLGLRKQAELMGPNRPVGNYGPPGVSGTGGVLLQEQVTRTLRSGPLPSPEDLAEYDKVKPGLADRIVTMAENQAKHRQEMEKTSVTSVAADAVASRAERKRGQVIAALVIFAGLGAAVALGVWGQSAWANVVGGMVGGFPIVAVVVAFMTGKKDGDGKSSHEAAPVKSDLPD